MEQASGVAVSSELTGFTGVVVATFGSEPTDGVVGIFSQGASFGARDVARVREVAELFSLTPEPGKTKFLSEPRSERPAEAFAQLPAYSEHWEVIAGILAVLTIACILLLPHVERGHATQSAKIAIPPKAESRVDGRATLGADGVAKPTESVAPMPETAKPAAEKTQALPAPREAPETEATNRLPLSDRMVAANVAVTPPLTSPSETAGTTPRVEVNTENSGAIDTPESDATAAAVPTPKVMPAETVPQFEQAQLLHAHSGWVTGVAFSADGRRLASGNWDHAVEVWDVASGRSVGSIKGDIKHIQALAYSRDGSVVAAEAADDSVTLWNTATGKVLRKFPGNRSLLGLHSGWVYSIAFSPDGRWLASAIDNKTVRVWDVNTGKMVRDLTGEKRSVIYIAFSQGGKMLATGDDDKTISVWDVASGTVLSRLKGHRKNVTAVAFSPDGQRLASASDDKTIKIWDFARGSEVATLRGHRERVSSVAFGPDGQWLASGSWDGTIRIWDVNTGQQLEELPAQTKDVYAIAVDARGRRLAAGGEDGTVRIWNLRNATSAGGIATAH